VVDNRSGASGMIGADLVAKAVPDGHVLLLTAGSTITTNPFIYPRIPYDTGKDLVPVAAVARIALFLVCRPDLPVRDVGEFIAYLKAHPGRLSYGSAGNGTGLHLAGELFKRDGGVQALHVPFRGASPALQSLLAGQIDFMFDPGIAMSHVRAGRLRMLAVAVPQRSAAFPEVPTLDEAGLVGFDAGTTHGVYAPAGVPAEIVGRVNHEVNRALASDRVRAQIAAIGAAPSPMSVARFSAQMARDSERYGAIVRERNIRAE
jgi:tripartite-type tricarboxylate transporter receptor subunit TctC